MVEARCDTYGVTGSRTQNNNITSEGDTAGLIGQKITTSWNSETTPRTKILQMDYTYNAQGQLHTERQQNSSSDNNQKLTTTTVRCQLSCPLGANYLGRLIVISYSCYYLLLYIYLIAVFFDNSRPSFR